MVIQEEKVTNGPRVAFMTRISYGMNYSYRSEVVHA